LADANESRDWRIWSDLAAVLIRRARKLYLDEDLGLDLKNTVYALDATTIESIYSAIYAMPRCELRSEVIALLRKSHKTRKPRTRGDDRRGLIPNMTSIDERPLEVSQRLVPGHWEGDLIKGAYNRSQIGTLVERTTLFTVLARVDSATAFGTANAFSTVLNKVDAQMRLSMTYDQGREMAAHSLLTQNTGVQVYFAHPHSPWERGINENTNDLLRQYFPKWSDLSVHSQ
jgi:IS30 family transposase